MHLRCDIFPLMQASCQCGKLSAVIARNAQAMTVLCHCRDCQRRSGSPFGLIAYYDKGEVSITGEAAEFTRATDDGNHFTNGFCPRCGSTVWAKASKYPQLLGITVGTMADPAFPAPARSVYERTRHTG